MNLKNFLTGEIIGLKMEIMDSKNKNLIGIKGVVIDETKNTLAIKEDNIVKTILKKQVVLKFNYGENNIIVDGNLLIGRPEDRIKK